jgi:uncharacterized protein YbjT (DUF2867 family)
MDPSGPRILIVGATGLLGAPLARGFARQGYRVRVMARDAARLAKTFPQGFDRAAGDATNARDVEQALEGCAGVHVSVANMNDEASAVEAIARAAKRLGVGRISYVSGTSVCEENAWFPLIAGKLRAERVLQAGTVPFTIFRPTWFMETVANFFKHGRAVCFGRGETRLHFVASEDFAAVVPRAYASRAAENRVFQILGPEAIRLVDAIDRYRSALHPEIRTVTRLPIPVARAIAFVRGSSGREMAEAAALVRYFERAFEGTREPEGEGLLGRCSTTLDTWLNAKRAERSRSLRTAAC